MTQINKFADLGIAPVKRSFEGTKVEIDSILNNEITVYEYKVADSKYTKENTSGKCLHLQIGIGAAKHVLFTGSSNLIDMIERIPKDRFPFSTRIIKQNRALLFT